MDQIMKRSTLKEQDPDLGILAVQLSARVQREIFRRSAEQGFDDVRPRHGAVLAYLDAEGTRPGELARLAGRNKQTMGAILDELERLGYVRRTPDPADRRAKLIVPTDRGLRFIAASDGFVHLIEQKLADTLGPDRYRDFRDALARGVASLPATGPDTEG
ncbi:MarR family transcriptional regulator [Micromonospora sp. NBC_00362]|uniref:MarR family winged helix-turn-helix transcriptional regulator n=2 Tax=Micromonospora TaxID=1873 RepID=UPI00224FE780|nr:MarR family transcriptional regulator [Micromonospora sp. NBC_00362]MCX5115770.1 MarR family transcriptional regulator [Micromonospora sp. NBC_00362]WTI05911.1 MarR family transcriptional regulator [Micromonospora sp. NBC_00821]